MPSKVGRRLKWLFTTAICTSMLDPFGFTHAAGFAAPEHGENVDAAAAFHTESPIKHVIILIGENRGFDHTFGVYKPKGHGQTISNILSKGIVDKDGSPGHELWVGGAICGEPADELLCRGAGQCQDAVRPVQSDAAAQYQRSAAEPVFFNRQQHRDELQHRPVHHDPSRAGYSFSAFKLHENCKRLLFTEYYYLFTLILWWGLVAPPELSPDAGCNCSSPGT